MVKMQNTQKRTEKKEENGLIKCYLLLKNKIIYIHLTNKQKKTNRKYYIYTFIYIHTLL